VRNNIRLTLVSPLSNAEPLPPDPPPARYSSLVFPAYRFVPGRNPHPTRDPEGHSYGVQRIVAARFDPNEWRTCVGYLYGVDLFNYAYWWEAHEAWEGLWVAAGRQTQTGQFLQGLIQVSVAHLKWFQGLTSPAQRLVREGFIRMGRSPMMFLGIEVRRLQRDVEAYFVGAREVSPIIQLIGFRPF
jgi:Uncharacterized conserved protein